MFQSRRIPPGQAPIRGNVERREAAPILPKVELPTYGSENSTKSRSADENGSECHDLVPSQDGHQPFLDLTRIACVAGVCLDHGNFTFGCWNIAFAQNWVLQFLFIVSGISFGMSKKSLPDYLARLAKYVAVGIGVNWTAWLVAGLDWQHNFFNVVFQNWFVVGLMGYAVILAPLRPTLQRLRDTEQEYMITRGGRQEDVAATEQRHNLLQILVYIFGGILSILLIFQVLISPCLAALLSKPLLLLTAHVGKGGSFWGLPTTTPEAVIFIRRMCVYVNLTASNLYLVFVCPRVFQRVAITGWMIILNTYASRAIFYRHSDERPWHGLDLMMLGLVCFYLGLLNRRKIGEYIMRYWFVLLLFCSLLWPPGLNIRLDEQPPTDDLLRTRYACLEAVFVVTWLVAGERMVQTEIFTEDRMEFMNDWALLAFLTHKAIHILLSPPFNWLAIIALIPLCYYMRHKV